MKTFNQIALLSVLAVGLTVAACAEKKSKKTEEKVNVTEFITEQVDLNSPQKTSGQAELSEEEMNEAKAIYSLIKLSAENNAKIYSYIPFKSDSDVKKGLKEKKLSQASEELKTLIRTVQEKCTISSSEFDKTGTKIENSISGESCPINEKIQMTSLMKTINPDEKNQKISRSTGTYAYTEELKYNEDILTVTKIKSYKGLLKGTIKNESALDEKQKKSYSNGTGKIEVVSADNKSTLIALKVGSSTSQDKENNITNTRTEAKVTLSTKKEILITIIKKEINSVTISKKAYINDKEIETSKD